MIQPGTKLIPVQYTLTNIDEYPDYVFLMYTFAPMIRFSEIKPGEAVGGYKYSSANIYAIPASEYSKITIGDNDRNIKQFFENNPCLIQSNVQLTFLGKEVPSIDPLETQIINLEIQEITQAVLTLRLSSIHYRYSDGSIKKVPYPTTYLTPAIIYPSTLPEPPSHTIDGLWYFIVPSIALVGIVLLTTIVKPKDN